MADTAQRSVVFVVEDEVGIRELLTDILTDLGYSAIAFPDGEAAIETLARGDSRVRLAIVDLALPGKGGIETLQALREIEPRLPGIISTGFENSSTGEDGLDLREIARRDGFEVLVKPYKIDQLALVIERALGTGSA